ADSRERRAEIDRRRGLAHPALLIGESDDPGASRSEGVHGAFARRERSDVTSTTCESGEVRLGWSLAVKSKLARAASISDSASRPFKNSPRVADPKNGLASSKRRGNGASARALTTSGVRLWALSARSSMRIA